MVQVYRISFYVLLQKSLKKVKSSNCNPPHAQQEIQPITGSCQLIYCKRSYIITIFTFVQLTRTPLLSNLSTLNASCSVKLFCHCIKLSIQMYIGCMPVQFGSVLLLLLQDQCYSPPLPFRSHSNRYHQLLQCATELFRVYI